MANNLDTSKENSSWGGKREGAGRPKGSMNPDSRERATKKREFIKRINKNIDKLFNAQLDLATGEKYLMVKKVQGEGKNRKTWIEVVTDIETIKDYLDDDGVTLNQEAGEDFYYMSIKPANNMALDSLLNRAFGKAEEKLDITSLGEKLGDAQVSELTDEELNERIESYLKNRDS